MDIILSTVGSVVRKWKLEHATQAPPRLGSPPKLSTEITCLVRETMVRPTVTLKEFYYSVA